MPTAEDEAMAASHAELIPSSRIWCITRTPRWPAKISTSALDVKITVSRTRGTSRSAVMIRRASVKYIECRCFAVSASSNRGCAQAGCLSGTKARMYDITQRYHYRSLTTNSSFVPVGREPLQCG